MDTEQRAREIVEDSQALIPTDWYIVRLRITAALRKAWADGEKAAATKFQVLFTLGQQDLKASAEAMSVLDAQLAAAQAENERLREALEPFLEPGNWFYHDYEERWLFMPVETLKPSPDEVARAALALAPRDAAGG